jgi:hypothetical protein
MNRHNKTGRTNAKLLERARQQMALLRVARDDLVKRAGFV